jgi:hypothetical protein
MFQRILGSPVAREEKHASGQYECRFKVGGG